MEPSVRLRHHRERNQTPSERLRHARTNHPCSSLHVFSSCSVAGANHQRPEAEAAGTILDEISRQWTGEADASGGVLAHGAPGFSRESICDEFQAPSMADGGPEWRYFSGRYGKIGRASCRERV